VISSHIYKKLLHFSIILFLIATIIPQISTVENAQSTELGILNNEGPFQGNIELSYDSSDIEDEIIPQDETREIDLYINYYVSGILTEYLIPLLGDITVPIQLSIGDHPDYVNIELDPKIVYLKVSTTESSSPEISKISISVGTNAPAFQRLLFNVSAVSSQVKGRFNILNWVRSAINKIQIIYKPGYYSNFRYDFDPFREIGAGNITTIPVNITGYSNAMSKLSFEIIDPPENWSTSINQEYLLGSAVYGQKTTGTVDFTVQAPLTPGYHNEVEQFQIRVTTMAAGHPEVGIDNTTILQFTVRSRGHINGENSMDMISSYIIAIVLTTISAIIILTLIVILKKKHKIQK